MSKGARFVVLQDGSRLHYAVPVALHRWGLLERVFCDWYSSPWSLQRAAGKVIAMGGMELGRRMQDRYTSELKGAKVISNSSMVWQAAQLKKRMPTEQAYFRELNARILRWVQREGTGGGNAFFGFIRTMEPELCRWMRKEGLRTVGDQIIAPFAVQKAEELKQRERYGEFTTGPYSEGENWWGELEAETWAALDHITCASDYVRKELMALGVESARITVNPYPINPEDFPSVDRRERRSSGPLTVGFVGGVNLRKGAPQFWEVARQFDAAKVRFVMVGPVAISEAAVKKYAGQVELVGAVPRSEVVEWLRRFDVYFFPSTCEGSAGSVVEAMATGLPVVTSPNSGTLVEEGVSGRVLAYDDVNGYVKAIEELAADGEKRLAMGEAARQRVEEFGLERFGGVLAGVLGELS